MTRLVVELSVATQIPFRYFTELSEQVLSTYIDVIEERNKQTGP